jgi:hypothetical protein
MKELIKKILRGNNNLNSNQLGDIVDESEVYKYVQKIHNNYDDFIDGDIGERIERFPKYRLSLVDIDKINTDEYYLDEDMVDEYVEKYKKTETYPPIVLGYYDSRWGYGIIDGNHRANALKTIGLKKIKCFVGLNNEQKFVY